MPKIRRIIPVNAAMHLINRGNNRQCIFNNDADKLRYYSLMLELKQENNITVFHYCLMDNHPHLIVWLNDKSRLSKFMKQLSLSYYTYYKKSYGYSGHLWQGRFKSNIIDTYGKPDSLLTPNPAYLALSDSPEARRKQYIDFVVDSSIINAEKLRKQQFIGTYHFISKLELLYGVKNELFERGRPKKPEK